MTAYRTEKCLFRKLCTFLKVTTNTYTNNHRRARIRTGLFYTVNNGIFNTFNTVRRLEHINFTHIFATKSLWSNINFNLISLNYVVMNNSRGIILCIDS